MGRCAGKYQEWQHKGVKHVFNRTKIHRKIPTDGGGLVQSEQGVAKLDSGEYEIQALPVQPEPTIDEQNAVISDKRASEYARLIDPLHAEKTRKAVLGEWTDELESEYVAQVKALTKQIQDENPYVVAPEQTEPETAE